MHIVPNPTGHSIGYRNSSRLTAAYDPGRINSYWTDLNCFSASRRVDKAVVMQRWWNKLILTVATLFGDLTVNTSDCVTVVNPWADNVIRSFVPSAVFAGTKHVERTVNVWPGGITALHCRKIVWKKKTISSWSYRIMTNIGFEFKKYSTRGKDSFRYVQCRL